MSGAAHYIGRRTYDGLVGEIILMAHQYAAETDGLPSNSAQMFDYVRLIPYRPENMETLRAPSRTMKDGGDCDDKTILFCAWAIRRGIKSRVTLAGVSDEPGKYHHVFPELYINGKWWPYDATYSYGRIGKKLPCYDTFKSTEA